MPQVSAMDKAELKSVAMERHLLFATEQQERMGRTEQDNAHKSQTCHWRATELEVSMSVAEIHFKLFATA